MEIGFVFLIPLVVITVAAVVIFLIVLLIKWGLSGPQPSFKKKASSGSSDTGYTYGKLEDAKSQLRSLKNAEKDYLRCIDECNRNNGKYGLYDTAYYREELRKIQNKIIECERIIEEES